MTYRKIKPLVLKALQADELEAGLRFIRGIPPRRVVNPLFSLLYHGRPLVRWRAVSAMGETVSLLAREDLEGARVVMRRLMWNLNDESGGIGWGSPEAMGEIMARHRGLAEEYATILISYLNPCGNFLEHEGLQHGVLWALGRVAGAHPSLLQGVLPLILPFLSSCDPELRALALWSGRALPHGDRQIRKHLEAFLNDQAQVTLYLDGRLQTTTIAGLAGPPYRP